MTPHIGNRVRSKVTMNFLDDKGALLLPAQSLGTITGLTQSTYFPIHVCFDMFPDNRDWPCKLTELQFRAK
jgi:hypothetical protein